MADLLSVMNEFEESGDVVVDVSRLQARAVIALSKVKPKNERDEDRLSEAVENLKHARELMREWEDDRLASDADESVIAEMVERHVKRLIGPSKGPMRELTVMKLEQQKQDRETYADKLADALRWIVGDLGRVLNGDPVRNIDETIAHAERLVEDHALLRKESA